MDPKKNKPKTGSQPMNVDPATAARMSNLPAGGRKNIRIRKLSDEEKAQSRQSKIKGGLERVTGRSFGGGEPTAGGDVDPNTGNLLPKDPRRPKKNRNVGGPAGPGDIDPETGDLIGEGVKKAGHPESFELGLDAETTDNPEYQKILRQKRIERAKQMLNPKLARSMSDDVPQDDIEAADKAARGRKFNPRNVGKDAY